MPIARRKEPKEPEFKRQSMDSEPPVLPEMPTPEPSEPSETFKDVEERTKLEQLRKTIADAEQYIKKATTKKDSWEVKQVALQTAPIIANNETGERLQVEEALCRILNKLEK